MKLYIVKYRHMGEVYTGSEFEGEVYVVAASSDEARAKAKETPSVKRWKKITIIYPGREVSVPGYEITVKKRGKQP